MERSEDENTNRISAMRMRVITYRKDNLVSSIHAMFTSNGTLHKINKTVLCTSTFQSHSRATERREDESTQNIQCLLR